jgi:hypothetical protein
MSSNDPFRASLDGTMRERLAVHKGRREAPGVDPRVDTLIGMVLSLTSEVAVLRERLDAHERLAATGGFTGPEAVDAYEPDEAVEAARAAQRQRLLAKVCRPLLAESANEAADKGRKQETVGDPE